jgi:cell wall-associated NlpC family hydrolase
MLCRTVLSVFVLLGSASALAKDEPLGDRLVRAARELLDVRYDFGGRMRTTPEGLEGIDCQGVLFYAAERVGACGWRSFSVFPTVSVARGELGKPVEGMSPISSDKLDLSRLRPGDVLLLVGFDENPAEPAIGVLEDRRVWVWHTGMYTGDGNWIVGDHYAGRVVETDLRHYLGTHREYVGVFVTRMTEASAPRRCRKHRPMTIPRS